ncbi:MAG: 2-oxoglutarate and iron-dependent oxygenase domain-containing protein, partial [Pseudoalteromonas sp.]|uniref:2-oxoglutarate and iron-dependent oxygenase domain-containing protein n=1 Tax=Pseudoalteromonas sp. TaxID=53249 RepID=UPI001D493FC7
MQHLPTVDYKASDAAAQFVESLRNTGFGVLKNHPIPQSLVESIYKNWQEFFNSEQKHEFLFSKETQDGYFPPSVSEVAKGFTVKDIKEYYHFYPWGQCPDTLRPQISQYYEEANGLAKEV